MLGLPYTLSEIAQQIEAIDCFQGLPESVPLKYVSFDSRTISHGRQSIFVALKTANRDGHDFIADALQKGVQHFITERPLPYREINYLLVPNSLQALQQWAAAHRRKFSYPLIAITGSNGKTILKEWLATLLEAQLQIVKSPMSYNSQLGVPLSLLQMHPQADLAIIEAGISQKGEMQALHQMIQPTLGALTHIGDAHADGFESELEKLQEKLRLFEGVHALFTTSTQWWVMEQLEQYALPLKTVGKLETDSLQLLKARDDGESWELRLTDHLQEYEWMLPVSGRAALENALLAILIARHLGISMKEIQQRLLMLYPVEMRSEVISDNPEITILNDSYNSDPDSIRNAFRMLSNIRVHKRARIILSDIPHLGENQKAIQADILSEAEGLVGRQNVYTVGPVFMGIRSYKAFANTQSLLENLRYEDFQYSTVLLKGARKFGLERVIPLLNRKLNASWFRIDLNALHANYRQLKGRLPTGVKCMCMVKAASYGSGTWEIARELEQAGADYLAVAYTSEGISLRQAHIQLPIMVMNPDPASIPALVQFGLEPEVYRLDFLDRYVRAARLAQLQTYPIHLKFDTGMGRLGFEADELDELIAYMEQYPDIQIVSVMTHLAAADDVEEDVFNQEQIRLFLSMYERLQEELGIFSIRHVLNTAGILRLPQYAFEMVRMGIGLYGIPPARHLASANLKEIGSLHSTISQLHHYPAGKSIGYGRSQYTQRPTTIATIPIGYADGIPRALGNGRLQALVRGQRAPTFGRICMDMLMLDVTDLPEVKEGDEVVIWGRQGEAFVSIWEVAEAAGTIPYELLVRLSPRVRRVYVRE